MYEYPEKPDNFELPPNNRTAIAEFLVANKDRIRTLARSRLSKQSRSHTDSEDVYSSVCRRVVDLTSNGKWLPVSNGHLWRMIESITINTAVSRTRLSLRLQNVFAEYAVLHQLVWNTIDVDGDEEEFISAVIALTARIELPQERVMFRMRLHGLSHRLIAENLGISDADARQQWHRLCKRLQEQLQQRGKNSER